MQIVTLAEHPEVVSARQIYLKKRYDSTPDLNASQTRAAYIFQRQFQTSTMLTYPLTQDMRFLELKQLLVMQTWNFQNSQCLTYLINSNLQLLG